MRQRQHIENTVGPAPWYWQTFPEITSAAGKKFIWQHHGESGPIGYLVTLNLRQSPETNVLALNTSCRPFACGTLLGIWAQEQPFARGEKPYLRAMAFDPDELKPFDLTEVVGYFKQSNDTVYAATPPIAEFEIPADLAPGKHRLQVPSEFAAIDELLLVSNVNAQARGFDASAVVYALRPAQGEVEVLPQRWFDPKQYDLSRQWIARVARDPSTGKLIGDGIKVKAFELADNGCDFGRWIE